MKEARELMLEHCRGPYQIVEEGTGKSSGQWQVRYRCGQVPREVPGEQGERTPDSSGDDGYRQHAVLDAGLEPSAPRTDAGVSSSSQPAPDAS